MNSQLKIVLFKACICYDFSFHRSIFLFSRGDTHGSNSVMAIVFSLSISFACLLDVEIFLFWTRARGS